MRQLIGAIVASSITCGVAYADGKVVITPVIKSDKTVSGQPIVLPKEGAEVVASIYEVPPFTKLQPHKHPFPRYGYVISGQLRVTNADTGQISNFEPGEFAVEAIDQWHRGENPGDKTLMLLVIDQVPPGTNNVQTTE